jgi:thiamine-phosphate pyrophosphorylase
VFDASVIRLIAITDGLAAGTEHLITRARAAERGGATCVQLRLKDVPVRKVLEVARALAAALTIPVIVNDRLDVALASGAAGAHLGPDDLPIAAARALVGPDFILGTSVGSDAEIANAALADYVGIGPVFATGTKDDAGSAIGPDEVRRLASVVGKPAVAIGGINAANAQIALSSGVNGIAVVSAIFGSSDPENAARALRSATGR